MGRETATVRLLLDTHVAIWAVSAVERLPPSAVDMIEDTTNVVAVSLASLWEIAIKNNLGRAPREPIGLSLAEAIAEFETASFTILPIERQHLAGVERLPHVHGDPFDRLLVATAYADTYRLMTNDRTLTAYGDHVFLV